MDFSEDQLEYFESIINNGDSPLEIATYVDPDALVISDGEDSIRVSQGKQENEMLVEADGKTHTVVTTASTRIASMELGLRRLRKNYDGDLEETALSL